MHRTFNNAQLCFRRAFLKSQRVKGLSVVVYCNPAVWAGKPQHTCSSLYKHCHSGRCLHMHVLLKREWNSATGKTLERLKSGKVCWKRPLCASLLDSNWKSCRHSRVLKAFSSSLTRLSKQINKHTFTPVCVTFTLRSLYKAIFNYIQ